MQETVGFAEIKESAGIFRIRLDYLLKQLGGFFVLVFGFRFFVERSITHSQSEVRLGIVGIQLDSLFKGFDGLLILIILIKFFALIDERLRFLLCLLNIIRIRQTLTSVCVQVAVFCLSTPGEGSD